jgi:hypothetical protein
MPSIRMKTDSAGPNGNRYTGKVYSVTAEEGAALVQGRYAEWVEPPRVKAVEVAVKPEPENAALRTKPPKKRR